MLDRKNFKVTQAKAGFARIRTEVQAALPRSDYLSFIVQSSILFSFFLSDQFVLPDQIVLDERAGVVGVHLGVLAVAADQVTARTHGAKNILVLGAEFRNVHGRQLRQAAGRGDILQHGRGTGACGGE